MLELRTDAYSRILPLLSHPFLSVEAKSVAQGNAPGWIYVDSRESPQVALICSKGIEGFYLAGSPKLSGLDHILYHHIREIITPRVHKMGWSWFEVSGCSPDWNPLIENTFSRCSLEREIDLIYRLESEESHLKRQPISDVAIHRLDRTFFANPPCNDLSFTEKKISLFWHTLESYLSLGIGFCAVRDATVVSMCITGFTVDRIHVIDIETLEPYQKQGLGYSVGSAFIEECLQQKMIPHWGCMEENIASCALASRLGLKRVLEYSLFYFPLSSMK